MFTTKKKSTSFDWMLRGSRANQESLHYLLCTEMLSRIFPFNEAQWAGVNNPSSKHNANQTLNHAKQYTVDTIY